MTSSWAREVGAVDGLFPGLETKLRPLLVLLKLFPLFTLAVSEADVGGSAAAEAAE